MIQVVCAVLLSLFATPPVPFLAADTQVPTVLYDVAPWRVGRTAMDGTPACVVGNGEAENGAALMLVGGDLWGYAAVYSPGWNFADAVGSLRLVGDDGDTEFVPDAVYTGTTAIFYHGNDPQAAAILLTIGHGTRLTVRGRLDEELASFPMGDVKPAILAFMRCLESLPPAKLP